MEKGPQPAQPEPWLAARRMILEEIRIEGLPMDDIPLLLNNDAIASRLADKAQARLDAAGIEVDSLDMVEAVLDIINDPWSSDDEEDGGTGVREPRRPYPSTGTGSIALPEEDSRTGS